MYSENISGAERLPNGNTIICSGTIGEFREVTSKGEVVWKYVCPVELAGIMTQGNLPAADAAREGETMNSVFRVYKYPLDYAAFVGKTLIPGDFIEKYSSSTNSLSKETNLVQAFPNPFSDYIRIQPSTNIVNMEMVNAIGQLIWSGKEIANQDFSYLSDGLYFLKVKSNLSTQTVRLIKR